MKLWWPLVGSYLIKIPLQEQSIEQIFIGLRYNNITIDIIYNNYMGFCDALMAPSGVAVNQNTIVWITNKTYLLYN